MAVCAPPINRDFLEALILPHVLKPARYLGLEQGAYRKPFDQATVTMAVVFPDLYEIGVSNYGLKLLYSLVNQQPEYMCDRAYAPALDMMAQMAQYELPLYGVESFVPLREFDLLAFTLQYELNYTTLLGTLDSAQIPLRSEHRDDRFPLLIAGGPGSANPMPLSPFFDAFIIGDGEEVLLEILHVIKTGKKQGLSNPQIKHNLAKLIGVFVPGISEQADKRIVDIAEHPIELAPLIPAIEAVHDRVVVEARRGCDRMCRFCQPCFINLPVREQSIEQIKKSALADIEKTGYEECSLLSLSIADYSYFKPMILEVADALADEGVSLSLPSQRADRFSVEVAEAVQQVRKSTLTFAPEAGTQRLRDVINKNLSDEEILNAVTSAYETGWNKVKLYFIIGLPTETLDDLDGIYDIVKRLQTTCNAIKRDKALSIRKLLEINVTLSNFVPKPHTPFQWFPQDTMAVLNGKIRYLKDKFRGLKGVKLNFTDPEISKLEGFISKGGPELADVIEQAYKNGAYLDAWDDIRNFKKWFDAINAAGMDVEAYTRDRCCDPDEPLPWDCIDVGLDKVWLKDEYERAKAAATTVPCFEACSTCGVCANYSTWPKFIKPPVSEVTPEPTPSITDSPLEALITATRPPAVIKARLLIQKKGHLKFVSHLDWIRLIYRAVLRAGLPVAYSQGFNPKPKIAFSPALPLFSEALGDYIDIELTEHSQAWSENLILRLNDFLPEGGKALKMRWVPIGHPSIDKSIQAWVYRAKAIVIPGFGGDPKSLERSTCQFDVKEYTDIDPVRDIARDLADRLSRLDSIVCPVQDKSSTQFLDLTPYLEWFHVVPDDTHSSPASNNLWIEFRIRRLNRQDPGAQPTENLQFMSHHAKTGFMSIKPAWVLQVLNAEYQNQYPDHPPLSWQLVRSELVLAS